MLECYFKSNEEAREQMKVLRVNDIMEIFGVSMSTGYDIIKAIKSISDILRLSGRCTVYDLNTWYTYRAKQEAKKANQ